MFIERYGRQMDVKTALCSYATLLTQDVIRKLIQRFLNVMDVKTTLCFYQRKVTMTVKSRCKVLFLYRIQN